MTITMSKPAGSLSRGCLWAGILSFAFGPAFGLSAPNAVNTTTYQATSTVAKATHMFADGMGKKLQSHEEVGADDIVTGYVYDNYGRLVKTTKPFILSASHQYIASSDLTGQANTYYDGSSSARPAGGGFAYSEEVYYNDPTGRVKSHGEPGAAFAASAHPVKSWFLGRATPDPLPQPLTDAMLDGFTEANALYYLKVNKDANGHYTQQVSDAMGNLLVTWGDPSSAAGDEIVSMNQYDNVGHLTASYPPGPGGAVDYSRSTYQDYLTTGEMFDQYTPDKGYVQYVYNRQGQLRFFMTSRDAQSAPTGYQLFHVIKYDALGREIGRGVWESNVADQDYFKQANADVADFPVDLTPDIVKQYDVSTDLQNWFPGTSGPVLVKNLKNLKGRLAADVNYNYYIDRPAMNFYSYDGDGRLALNYKYVEGLPVQGVSYSYDLQGNVISKKLQSFDDAGTATATSTWTYTYANGRLTSIARDGVQYVSYTQLPTGELSARVFYKNGTVAGREAIVNNVRDWPVKLQGYNAAGTLQFEEDLNYESGTTTPAQYNGNVAKAKYNYQNSSVVQTLDYTYDQVDRLTNATDGSGNFQERYSYDASGRIVTKNETSAQNAGAYQYQDGTNRLDYIQNHPTKGDVNGVYVYDPDGNMVFDRSKMMTATYDGQGMPVQFLFYQGLPDQRYTWQDIRNGFSTASSGEVDMVYDANGKRVLKVSDALTTFYVDDLAVYEWPSTGSLKLDHQNITGPYGQEGRVLATNGADFVFKDHLGSTRVVMSDAQSVQESFEYHAYGNLKVLRSSSTPTRERFTGKELDRDGFGQGMQLTYFGARYYDADLGLWISPDKKRQYYSAFTYCGDNPATCVDPDGNSGFQGITVEGGLNLIFSFQFQNSAVTQVENLPMTTLGAADKANSYVNLAANGVALVIPPLAPEALVVASATDVLGVGLKAGKYSLEPTAENGKELLVSSLLFAGGRAIGARGNVMEEEGKITRLDAERGEASGGLIGHWIEFLFGSNKSSEGD